MLEQAGGSQSLRLQPPTLALSPSSGRGTNAGWTGAPWSTALPGRSSSFAEPQSSPLPVQQGRRAAACLKSSVHELCKVVCEQLFSRRSLAGLHKNTPQEVPAVLRDVGGQLRIGGLGGNLENGGHGFIFCPRWFLCQHLYHSAAQAPGEKIPCHPLVSPRLPDLPTAVKGGAFLRTP